MCSNDHNFKSIFKILKILFKKKIQLYTCISVCVWVHVHVCIRSCVYVLPWKQMFVSNDKWNKSRARWCFTFCMMLALLVCPRHSALQYSRMSCFGPIFRDPVKYNMPSVKLIGINQTGTVTQAAVTVSSQFTENSCNISMQINL